MSRKTILLVASLLVAQGAFLAVWYTVQQSRAPSAESSRPGTVVEFRGEETLDVELPDATLRTVGGTEIRLSDPPAGGVVLHFWGTWCPPCVDELPLFLKRARNAEGAALAIAIDDDIESLRAFFDGQVPDDVVIGAPRLLEVLGVVQLPQTIFVDPRGVATRRWVGAREWTETDWQQVRAE